jgi:hypothetical protein
MVQFSLFSLKTAKSTALDCDPLMAVGQVHFIKVEWVYSEEPIVPKE